jgi:hypothetical protein
METNTAYFQDTTYVDVGKQEFEKQDLLPQIGNLEKTMNGSGTLRVSRQNLQKDNSGAVRYQKTAFLSAYFSSENINNIQKLLKLNVFKHTNAVIDDQDVYELISVMSYIYELYGRHPAELSSATTKDSLDKLRQVYTFEIDRLNQLVLNETLKQLVTELKMHLYYLDDMTAPRVIENPVYTTTTGERDYKSIIQTLTGTPDEV